MSALAQTIFAENSAATPPLTSLVTPSVRVLPLHHDQHNTAFDRALQVAGITSTAISLSPLLMRKAGIGVEQFDFWRDHCCPVIQKNGPSWTVIPRGDGVFEPTYGIAGAVSSALERLPVVGGELSRGGIANALTAGGLMLVGHYGGRALGHRGRWLDTAMKALGVVVAVPAVLPGIGHGLAYLSTVAGIDTIDVTNRDATGPATALMGLLGKAPGECKREGKLSDGAWGGLGMLCCALPAVLASLPTLFAPQQERQR
jgi:hypothetical protein